MLTVQHESPADSCSLQLLLLLLLLLLGTYLKPCSSLHRSFCDKARTMKQVLWQEGCLPRDTQHPTSPGWNRLASLHTAQLLLLLDVHLRSCSSCSAQPHMLPVRLDVHLKPGSSCSAQPHVLPVRLDDTSWLRCSSATAAAGCPCEILFLLHTYGILGTVC